MFTEAQNLSITRTALDTVFFQEFDYDRVEPGIATARTGELFKVVNTEHSAYIFQVNKPVGLFTAIGESAAVPAGTPQVTNTTTVSVLDYAQKIVLSKDLFDDNMHGVWAENVRQFAEAARLTQDSKAFGLFRNAFTTTLTPDGDAAISTHTLINGSTHSNLVTGALNSTNLNSAIVKLREQVNQAGVIMGGVPSILLVPSALFKTAIELTDSALISDSANNALNVYRSAYGFTVYSSPWLGAAAGGSDSAWFLLTRSHGVRRLIRQGIETALTHWSFSDNRTYTYQANYRENYYIADYIGLVGSTG